MSCLARTREVTVAGVSKNASTRREWTILFAILPLGNVTHAEAGIDAKGGDPGAPVNPNLKKKFITTTWISAIVFAILWLVVHFKLLTPDMIPWRHTS